jgi:hypothetical protein
MTATSSEVERAKSADGQLVATVLEIDAGAAYQFDYEVYVASTQTLRLGRPQVADLYGATRSEDVSGVSLHWIGPRELRIEYAHSESAWLRDSVHVWGVGNVHVALDSGVVDLTVPRQGIEHNLHNGSSANTATHLN